MEANYTISVQRNEFLSTKQASVHNMDVVFSPYNYLLSKEPDYYVYIYNVSDQSYKVTRVPVLREAVIPGKTGAGISPELFSRLKEKDKNGNVRSTDRWILATKLPSPVITPRTTTESDQIEFDAFDGRRYAMDIINPENLGIDQDAVIDPTYVYSQGNNLGAKGVFWSKNFPPTEAEVKQAENRMEKYYLSRLQEAKAVEVSNPKALQEMLGPEHHAAADYFGEETSWHGKKLKAVICDQCGERTRENSAFHRTEDGGFCVKDWDRAIRAGVRTRAQAYEATEDPKYAPKVTPIVPVSTGTVIVEEEKQ